MREAQARCDAREFVEWIAIYRQDPWSEERADARAAIVAATIANVNRPKGRRPHRMQEFMLQYKRPRKRQSMAEMKSILMAAAQAAQKCRR